MEKAREALRLYRDLTADAPDELASDIVLITMPDGTPVVGMVVCYAGPTEDGDRILRPLKSPLLMDGIGTMPYTSAQKLVGSTHLSALYRFAMASTARIARGAVIRSAARQVARLAAIASRDAKQ
jgi:hypothetical protein